MYVCLVSFRQKPRHGALGMIGMMQETSLLDVRNVICNRGFASVSCKAIQRTLNIQTFQQLEVCRCYLPLSSDYITCTYCTYVLIPVSEIPLL